MATIREVLVQAQVLDRLSDQANPALEMDALAARDDDWKSVAGELDNEEKLKITGALQTFDYDHADRAQDVYYYLGIV